MDSYTETALYQLLGERIRLARASLPGSLSQAALAQRLGVSRASVVNIEAGRQHAPLSLLWKIAEQLGVELGSLIPSRAELSAPPPGVDLPDDMRAQLKTLTKGDAELEGLLSSVIAQAVGQLTATAKQAPPKPRKRTS